MKTRKIRWGGLQTPHGFLFELTGGDLSLDFTNTVDNRPTNGSKELIPRYGDLLSWSKQSGVLTASQMRKLKERSERFPKAAENVRKEAVAIRECLFQVYSAMALKKAVPGKILSQLNGILQTTQKQYDLIQSRRQLEWKLRNGSDELDWILCPIVRAAADLLPSVKADRIRRCEGPRCNWLFLDHSKRGNRRWCDMTVCGNRVKARRYYQKTKRK